MLALVVMIDAIVLLGAAINSHNVMLSNKNFFIIPGKVLLYLAALSFIV